MGGPSRADAPPLGTVDVVDEGAMIEGPCTPSRVSRPLSLPCLHSEGNCRPVTLEAKRKEAAAARFAWLQKQIPAFQEELGTVLSQPRLATDVTDFSKEFIKVTGMPMHKAFPVEEAVLLDTRTQQRVAKWR